MLRIETLVSQTKAKGALTIKDGRLIRPSIYREAEASKEYAEEVKNSRIDEVCVFCSEAVKKNALDKHDSFYVLRAKPAYSHFDAQEVISHELLIPFQHVNTLRRLGLAARQEIQNYLWEREDASKKGETTRFQDYFRTPDNPSKSIDHAHIHMFELGLSVVRRLDYDIENGITQLEFEPPTPKQAKELQRTRLD